MAIAAPGAELDLLLVRGAKARPRDHVTQPPQSGPSEMSGWADLRCSPTLVQCAAAAHSVGGTSPKGSCAAAISLRERGNPSARPARAQAPKGYGRSARGPLGVPGVMGAAATRPPSLFARPRPDVGQR